jgi:hypothetical protein
MAIAILTQTGRVRISYGGVLMELYNIVVRVNGRSEMTIAATPITAEESPRPQLVKSATTTIGSVAMESGGIVNVLVETALGSITTLFLMRTAPATSTRGDKTLPSQAVLGR